MSGHAGTTEEATIFDAFGAPLNLATPGTGNDLLYTGRELDRETGLYYYRARYYDPEIGRFVSEDPLRFAAGVNFYAYVENNPVNFNDPSGECPLGGLICGGIAIGIGGVIGVGVPAIISNAIDYFTGASPDQIAAHNSAFLDVGAVVGGTALAPILFGTGIVAAEITTNFVLTNPILATEIFGGVAGRLLGGADFSEPTLSAPGAAAGFFTGVVSDVANSFSSSQSSAASGGFVLYPGKANTNQLQSVYAK